MTDQLADDRGEPQVPAAQPHFAPLEINQPGWSAFLAKHGHSLRNVLTVIFLAVALWLLHHEFASIKADGVAKNIRSMPWRAVLAALFFTVCNDCVLIGYDWLGVRFVKHPLAFRQVSVAALLYYAVSNSLGAVFGGTPVRCRQSKVGCTSSAGPCHCLSSNCLTSLEASSVRSC